MEAIRPVDGTVASNEPDWPSALAQGKFHRRAESDVNGPDPWNGLPAPWEPMTSMDSMPMPVPVSSPIEAPSAGLQTARRGRQVEAAYAEAERHEPPANHGVEQDLDALARQVYGILKRRLEAESRRGL